MKIYKEDVTVYWQVFCGHCLTEDAKIFLVEIPLEKPSNGKTTEEAYRCEYCLKYLPSRADEERGQA